MYKLPITITNERSLYSTNIGKQFLKHLKNNQHKQYLQTLKEENGNV